MRIRGYEKLRLSLAFCMLCFATSAAERRWFEIRNDGRPIIALDQFGFTHSGRVVLNVTRIQLSVSINKVNSPFQLSEVGFFLCTPDSWLHLLRQLEDGEISCAFESRVVKTVCTFDSLVNPDAEITTATTAFDVVYLQEDADQYDLFFANCFPQLLTVSMDVRSAMYNLDVETGAADYLSDGRSMLPMIYFLFSVLFMSITALWISILCRHRLNVHRIHVVMLAVVFSKTLDLLCEAEDQSYIQHTGSAHGWDVQFFLFGILKGIMIFTLLVLIGTGWSSVKPHLPETEKKILLIVLPLQVLSHVAQVAMDESDPHCQECSTWKRVLPAVDAVCCCSVLFAVVRSATKLRAAARQAAVSLSKLSLFRQYYIAVIFYIYFTRVAVYALETMTSYRYSWTRAVAAESATLIFYVFTGHKFEPEAHNQYSAIDDEAAEAAEAEADSCK